MPWIKTLMWIKFVLSPQNRSRLSPFKFQSRSVILLEYYLKQHKVHVVHPPPQDEKGFIVMDSGLGGRCSGWES